MNKVKGKVLVVEDTLTQFLRLQQMLEEDDFEVDLAASGREALNYLSQQKPSLILCDINMPEIDGYELCQKVKSDPSSNHIPFILLTSLIEGKDIMKILRCGADNFILKVLDEKYFLRHLDWILSTFCKTESAQLHTLLRYAQEEIEIESAASIRYANMLVSAFEIAVYQARLQIRRSD